MVGVVVGVIVVCCSLKDERARMNLSGVDINPAQRQ